MQYVPVRSFLVWSVLLVGTVGGLRAQALEGAGPAARAPGAYFQFSEPGDLTVVAKVWGNVSSPGLYRVVQGTHLSTLFTLAGGPATAQITRRTIRSITIRLVRPSDGGGDPEVVYTSTMRNGIFVFDEDPVLQDGDVLLVETYVRQRLGWRDIFTLTSGVASVALLLERFILPLF